VARYTRNPLRLLDRLYDFVGGLRTENRMDVSSPIIRVHDLSREAELGTYTGINRGSESQNFPMFTIVEDHVDVGAGEINSVLGVYSNQNTDWAQSTFIPPNPEDETVWMLAAYVNSLNGLLTEAMLGSEQTPKAGSGAGRAPNALIAHWTGVAGTSWADGTQPGSGVGARFAFPVPVTNKLVSGTPLEWSSAVSGADTVDLVIPCIRLPVGVFPPGLR